MTHRIALLLCALFDHKDYGYLDCSRCERCGMPLHTEGGGSMTPEEELNE